MRSLVALASGLVLSASFVGCKAGAASPFVSHEAVISLALSPNGRDLAYVTRKRDANVLRVRMADAAPQEVATDAVIRDVQFMDPHRVVYAAKDRIGLYDMRTGEGRVVVSGTRPVCLYGRDRLLYLQEGTTRLRDLATGEDSAVTKAGERLEPCDWIDKSAFLACSDGHLWRVSLDGGRARLLKGDRYAPRYVAARLSPDREKVLLVSDDTCADVGAGGRSLWLLRIGDREARQIATGTPNAQWLDNESVVMSTGSKLMTMDVTTGSVAEIQDCRAAIQAFGLRGRQIVVAVRQTDEDGLFTGSTVKVVKVTK